MNRRIYLASSWRNAAQPNIVQFLRSCSHQVYDFREPGEGKRGFAWSDIDPEWKSWTTEDYVAALEHPIAVSGYRNDFEAMQWADTCVLLLPCGRSAHIEAGWFAGCGKDLIVLQLEPHEPELMYKLARRVCYSLGSLLDALDEDHTRA